MTISGKVHSIETMGTLDGPGIRSVVFMQGCPLRCVFCHNIDAAQYEGGKPYTPEELTEKLLKSRKYWGEYQKGQPITGGVTISGGEPTMQAVFIKEVLRLLKQEGIHTAIDSCSATSAPILSSLAPFIDLWMLSVKHLDNAVHKELTGTENIRILENIRFIDRTISEQTLLSRIRLRFLVIPELTDSPKHIEQLAEFVQSIQNLETVEVLPYGSHGKYKWVEIYGEYALDHIRDATKTDIQQVSKILLEHNIPVLHHAISA